ncbi:MAG: hypothetical protein IKH32_04140 [Prevotella sp.]|nr:hypothetical protein [Prevotella sp.]
MVTTLLLLVALGLYTMFCYYKGREENDEEAKDDVVVCEQTDNDVEELGNCPTRVLVMRTLKNMGTEPELDEKENFRFQYQGEHFMIEADNDCLFINVYDLWWYHLSTYCDVEEFARMQKVVNLINSYSSCTVLYTINKDAEMIGVHSKKNMLFIQQIPNLEGYLASVLDVFFKVQRTVITEIEKMKVAEEQQ